jgi:hypothetical protein
MKAGFSILQIKGILGKYTIRQLYRESDDWHFTADFMTKRIYRRGDYEALNQISPTKQNSDGGKTWDLMAENQGLDTLLVYNIFR